MTIRQFDLIRKLVPRDSRITFRARIQYKREGEMWNHHRHHEKHSFYINPFFF